MIYLLFFMAAIIYLMFVKPAASPVNTVIESPQTPQIPDPEIVPEPVPPSVQEYNPQKNFIPPWLWKYESDESFDIWAARNYQNYIIPENPIVKYFADSVYLYQGEESLGMAPNTLKPRWVWKKAFPYDNKENSDQFPYFIYQKDQETFNRSDYWQNPDYYIYNGFVGDCEDYALLWASVFEYWKIPYWVVSGYSGNDGERDWVIEFKYQNKIYRGQVQYGMWEIAEYPVMYRPYMMFNKNNAIRTYQKWW